MAFLSSLADWGNKALDWYKDNPIVSDVLVPGGLSLYNTSQQKNAISGATRQRTAGIEQGLASLNQFYGTARQDAAPYMQGGLQGLGQYQALLADPNAVKESEDYKFRFGEGQQALERSAAAKGMLLSGNTLQDLQQYGQGFATRELDAALQRRIPLIETGLTSQQSLSNLGGDYARAIASLYGDIGEAEAQGTLGRSTATTGTLSDTLSILEGLGKGIDTVDMVTTGAQKLGSYLGLGGSSAAAGGFAAAMNTLGSLGAPSGAAQLMGIVPETSSYLGMLNTMDALGAGAGAASTGTAAGMTSGIGAGVGTGGSTAAAGSSGLSSALAAAPYFTAAFAMPSVLKALTGGGKNRGKFASLSQTAAQNPAGTVASMSASYLDPRRQVTSPANLTTMLALEKVGALPGNSIPQEVFDSPSLVNAFKTNDIAQLRKELEAGLAGMKPSDSLTMIYDRTTNPELKTRILSLLPVIDSDNLPTSEASIMQQLGRLRGRG